uniref:CaMBD domain-containing protein n=1 Tax=Syphacia muris TaxID=451379 RepID=A0A158R474_9BILA
MRVNGAIAPFRTLLTNPSTASTVIDCKALQRVTSLRRIHSDQNDTNNDYRLRRLSDAPILVLQGDQNLTKKPQSAAQEEDVEAQKCDFQETSKSPLMNAKEASKNQKSGRLIQRQQLFVVRQRTCDYALFFSLFGIGKYIQGYLNFYTATVFQNYNVAIKTVTLISTIILVGLVIRFHIIEVQLYMNANSAEDWRIAITFRHFFQIVAEIITCAICPLPFPVKVPLVCLQLKCTSYLCVLGGRAVPLDVMLSIPMFFRLYWAWRTHLLHSRMFTDASSRSIAGLNRVNFNARFIMKTLMTLCPGTMLIVFTATLWIVAAWILRLCESSTEIDGDPEEIVHKNYLNSLWVIAITFLSVGYGDIVPATHCGRAAAVVTGILGTCTSSMIVAVIARKLELSRAEKHVHNFMMDTQLTKKLKHSAANVLRETWLIYKNRRLVDKIDPAKIRLHQRKFLIAINALVSCSSSALI